MAEKSSTNVYWYILLAFILVLFIGGIQQFTASMLLNPKINSTLTNESMEYILMIQGIDISDYANISSTDIETDQAVGQNNQTGSQSKDYALEFFYSRSQASKLGLIIKGVYSFPEFIATLLNIPLTSILWLIATLNWFWRIALLIAIYYFIRGIVT